MIYKLYIGRRLENKEDIMPYGKGTYGSKRGRPPKKKKGRRKKKK